MKQKSYSFYSIDWKRLVLFPLTKILFGKRLRKGDSVNAHRPNLKNSAFTLEWSNYFIATIYPKFSLSPIYPVLFLYIFTQAFVVLRRM